MRSRSGIGRSQDASEELRQQLFDEWLENESRSVKQTQASLARKFGMLPQNWSTMRKNDWFLEKKQAVNKK